MKRRDIVFIALGIGLLAVVFLTASIPKLKRHAEAVHCISQMSSIGFASRLWAGDNTNNLPTDFLSMSNELCDPIILVCPSDVTRHPATNWNSFTSNNSSYLIVGVGQCTNFDDTIFIRCQVHGYSGYADGTVSVPGKNGRQTKPIW